MEPISLRDGAASPYAAKTVNVHEAKTHLSRLLERVAAGESFVIARAGKPVARLVPLETALSQATPRLGFMAGQLQVPDDFDTLGADVIEGLFDGQP